MSITGLFRILISISRRESSCYATFGRSQLLSTTDDVVSFCLLVAWSIVANADDVIAGHRDAAADPGWWQQMPSRLAFVVLVFEQQQSTPSSSPPVTCNGAPFRIPHRKRGVLECGSSGRHICVNIQTYFACKSIEM